MEENYYNFEETLISEKPKYYRNFETKREFEKWIEENIDKLDFDNIVTIDYSLKED